MAILGRAIDRWPGSREPRTILSWYRAVARHTLELNRLQTLQGAIQEVLMHGSDRMGEVGDAAAKPHVLSTKGAETAGVRCVHQALPRRGAQLGHLPRYRPRFGLVAAAPAEHTLYDKAQGTRLGNRQMLTDTVSQSANIWPTPAGFWPTLGQMFAKPGHFGGGSQHQPRGTSVR